MTLWENMTDMLEYKRNVKNTISLLNTLIKQVCFNKQSLHVQGSMYYYKVHVL